ncbi:hypothetical protein HW555_009182 [Spodoptera exigua]|uniref:Uncharacterized protein n=1 Tax=Spodoptera exigua TaxID=7107 RepID=A0A835L2P9_SPOEX|nr:hypothetical protein HW555_009182 [Spodoptera exigua]
MYSENISRFQNELSFITSWLPQHGTTFKITIVNKWFNLYLNSIRDVYGVHKVCESRDVSRPTSLRSALSQRVTQQNLVKMFRSVETAISFGGIDFAPKSLTSSCCYNGNRSAPYHLLFVTTVYSRPYSFECAKKNETSLRINKSFTRDRDDAYVWTTEQKIKVWTVGRNIFPIKKSIDRQKDNINQNIGMSPRREEARFALSNEGCRLCVPSIIK